MPRVDRAPTNMTPEPATHLSAVPPLGGGLPRDGAPPASPPPVAAARVGGSSLSNERPPDWNGVTPPRRTGGGAARFLTDVIVELGFVDRARVEQAVEAGRATGNTPEHVLLDQGALTQDNLAR